MEKNDTFHHALAIDDKKCIRCTHCMKACPTEAIRIVNGKVVIREERCVDCGECMRVCPQKAIYVQHDDLDKIWEYPNRVLLFPSVFLGQFPEWVTEEQVYASLLNLGFTHAFEVEQPIEVLKTMVRRSIKGNSTDLPVISSFCPAVVRLIRIKYPALTEQIMRVKAPHDLVAHYVLGEFGRKGIPASDVGLFYVTPCAAKIAAVKSPLGESESIITGVINSKQLYNKVMALAPTIPLIDTAAFRAELTKEGIQWSLTHGETWWQTAKCISVDGIHNAIRFLERLENGEVTGIDFLELRACDRSCAGGVLLTQNRFLTVERLKKRAKRYPASANKVSSDDRDAWLELEAKVVTDEIKPRPLLQYGTDVEMAIKRMERARNIMCHLPGIDCGACGAPTCRALAEDMVNGQARMSDCIFIQQQWQKAGKISPEKAFKKMEKMWGENRFDPDCTKKGAKDEGL
ncbi:MAG TPA: [Fe-Fe] hydrogenase large subunit C-terminal domain-containing protein [Prolixibacteraceae bacterium]|nr:[Fe-Fe] hydrogenase large subunit C-terminal domain-containing protein [Prolixibacteraceae bacterium]